MKSTSTGGTPSGGNSRTGRTSHGSGTAGSGGNGEVRWFDQSVCAFWLGEQCYGIASSLVGEVFLVEACTPVPVGPPSVIGLFNLRGTPVALVDLAMVLELPGIARPEVNNAMMALVLRTVGLLVGVRIGNMEVVIPGGRGLYRPPEETSQEHPMVAGFLELPERPELTITLLHPETLIAQINRLRYMESEEAS